MRIECGVMRVQADHHLHEAAQEIVEAARKANTPFAIYRPKLYPDGDQWCVLYGDNLQEGISGFGDTPENAADDFNHNWRKANE